MRAVTWRRLGVLPFDPVAIIWKRPLSSGRIEVRTGRSRSSGTLSASDCSRS